jgi:CRISPR/Cas system CSM-associated protein Csm3 (group 7 of RAMP superfamily)
VRNRVRIGHRGAAADKAKFDRAFMPAGYRFACELSLLDPVADSPDWLRLLDLLADPRLRLGGATRAGLGRMHLKSLATACVDLQGEDGRAALTRLGTGIGDTGNLSQSPIGASAEAVPDGWTRLDLKLKARDYWRIGQGSEPIRRPTPRGREDKDSDALPVLEPRVVWSTPKRAELALGLPLAPGSAIKGALVHRAEYYANCASLDDSSRWADSYEDGLDSGDAPPDRKDSGDRRHPAIQALFGFSKERCNEGEESGLAGRVFIDDVHIELSVAQVGKLMHNAIDRFTGGVRERLLFGEDLLLKTEIPVSVLVNRSADGPERQGLLDSGLAALRLAVLDLAQGRLAIGAGSGHGNGYLEADAPAGLDTLVLGERS